MKTLEDFKIETMAFIKAQEIINLEIKPDVGKLLNQSDDSKDNYCEYTYGFRRKRVKLPYDDN